MKAQWIGVSGAVLVLTALVLGTLGPRLLPTAFWRNAPVSLNGSGMMGNGMMRPGMINSGMMGNGMMGNGMMSGGMMSGMMGNGMMSGEVAGDSFQPFDQRFLNQMIIHHQGAVMSAQMMIDRVFMMLSVSRMSRNGGRLSVTPTSLFNAALRAPARTLCG